MESSINLFSLNVGMNASLAGLSTLIAANSLDIIFLQEVRLSSEQIELLLRGFKAVVNIDEENPSKPGTAIVWKASLPLTNISTLVLCRVQVATLGRYMLLNIYAASGSDKKHERNVFFGQDVFTALGLNNNPTWVLGGDFNCVLKPIDIDGGFGFAQKFSPALKDLINSASMKDVFRSSYPRLEEYTFFRAGKAPSRLDRFYISSEIFDSLTAVSHVASLSDHCGVKMVLKLNIEHLDIPKPQRSTYWKLNNSILVEEDFMSSFGLFWRSILRSKTSFVDISEWWDKHAKPNIKDFCIGFSINRKIQRNQTKQYLLSYLKLVLTDKDWNEVARVKGKLHSMLQADAQGVVVRSRFQQNSDNERASLFHSARELKNTKNSLGSLKIGNRTVKDEQTIEAKVVKFFGALLNGHHNADLEDTGVPFVPNNEHLGELLEGLGTLDDVDRDKLHKDITLEELEDVIKHCDNNKSPGLDGLTYEFYKAVWPLISEEFVQVLKCQLDQEKLIDSDTIGATRLTPKVAGVPGVDELRPITLLNCDYKILTKVFVRRIVPILQFVIRSGQLCTVGKKNILFGVNNVLSSLLYVKQKKIGACLISLDFFKAYDRVLVDFLLVVMKKMNFGQKFCNWVKMLHAGAKTRFWSECRCAGG